MEAVVAEGLVKRYVTKVRKGLRSRKKVVEALRGVSFRVSHGEVVGLLGPNGAGKTTTIRILSTLLLPDAGDAWVEGFHVVKDAFNVRRRIGVMLSVEKGFYPSLTGRDNLLYFALLKGIPKREARRIVDELLEVVGLKELGAADRKYSEYSLGMKARLALARALLGDPPVLFLDEPTLGLDPPSAIRVRSLVRDLAKRGKAVLYTTHNMFEAEIVCDRILFINKGVIVAEGSPEKLKEVFGLERAVKLKVVGDVKTLEDVLSRYGRVRNVRAEGNMVEIEVSSRDVVPVFTEAIPKILEYGFRVVTLSVEEPSLEEVFLKISGGR